MDAHYEFKEDKLTKFDCAGMMLLFVGVCFLSKKEDACL